MKRASCLLILTFISAAFAAPEHATVLKLGIDPAQVPTLSSDDLNFFLHGIIGTELVPEAVLRAFVKSYPDLFPTPDLNHLGLGSGQRIWVTDWFLAKAGQPFGQPVRCRDKCASCHFAQINSGSTTKPIGI